MKIYILLEGTRYSGSVEGVYYSLESAHLAKSLSEAYVKDRHLSVWPDRTFEDREFFTIIEEEVQE